MGSFCFRCLYICNSLWFLHGNPCSKRKTLGNVNYEYSFLYDYLLNIYILHSVLHTYANTVQNSILSVPKFKMQMLNCSFPELKLQWKVGAIFSNVLIFQISELGYSKLSIQIQKCSWEHNFLIFSKRIILGLKYLECKFVALHGCKSKSAVLVKFDN